MHPSNMVTGLLITASALGKISGSLPDIRCNLVFGKEFKQRYFFRSTRSSISTRTAQNGGINHNE